VKVVSITDVRQEATKLVELAQQTREPILICVRSRPAAYLIEAEEFEALQRDVKRLRHELFWRGVGEAEVEHRDGQSQTYESADALINDLGLEG
jgi:prevent-host-death family protein